MSVLMLINVWNIPSLLLSFVLIFLAYCKWSLGYWSRKGVVATKTSEAFKIFTRGETLGENVASVYKEYKSKGIRYCGHYFALRPIWVVLDLELLKTILTKDFEHFMDHGNYINEKNDPLTGQLFMLKGLKWKNLRVKLTPTFTSGKMKMMFPTLLDCSRELIVLMNKSAQEHTAVDIKDTIARFATDVIGSCAFGLECNTLKNPNSEFRIYGKKALQPNEHKIVRLLRSLLLTSFPFLMDLFKLTLFPKDVTKFFLGIVKDTVDYRETNGIVRKDFMHLLIQLKNNVNVDNDASFRSLASSHKLTKALSIEEMTAQAFVFFLAGFETSSTTLTFCFYELASNHNIQERVRQEVLQVFTKYNGELTYEALTDMVYLEMCINETLRKYPPLPILLRECTKTYKVPNSDLVIEKGTRLFISLSGIQHDPEYYPDPEKFDPERFSQKNKATRNPFTWLPFGEGPRICIGQRFGMMQMKVALSTLLKNYRFSINEQTQIPLELDPQSFITSTKGGVWVNVEKI